MTAAWPGAGARYMGEIPGLHAAPVNANDTFLDRGLEELSDDATVGMLLGLAWAHTRWKSALSGRCCAATMFTAAQLTR
jgi:hypothetical protein